jgi:hypothetical protein
MGLTLIDVSIAGIGGKRGETEKSDEGRAIIHEMIIIASR